MTKVDPVEVPDAEDAVAWWVVAAQWIAQHLHLNAFSPLPANALLPSHLVGALERSDLPCRMSGPR